MILTDLVMPDMEGLELVRRVRAEHPQIPVILVTAYGSEDVAMQALRAGAANYIPKKQLARDLVPTSGMSCRSPPCAANADAFSAAWSAVSRPLFSTTIPI